MCHWPLFTSHCIFVLWAWRVPYFLISSRFFVILLNIFIPFTVGGFQGIWSSIFLETNLPAHFSVLCLVPLPHWGHHNLPVAYLTDAFCPLFVDVTAAAVSAVHPSLSCKHPQCLALTITLQAPQFPPSSCPPVLFAGSYFGGQYGG